MSDGRPYGPFRYKEIVRECYFITKNTSTSYEEVLDMSPTERGYILEFLKDEFDKTKERIEEIKKESKKKKR